MTGCDRLVYQTCREAAGYTQEAAAEGLHCSVRTLARYESGEQAVPDDMAYHMTVLYDSQLLAVQHLRQASQVGALLVPQAEERDLTEATIRIVNKVRRFGEKHREWALLQMAEDGVISPDERPLFEEIVAELSEISRSALELRLSTPAATQKKRPRRDRRPGAVRASGLHRD